MDGVGKLWPTMTWRMCVVHLPYWQNMFIVKYESVTQCLVSFNPFRPNTDEESKSTKIFIVTLCGASKDFEALQGNVKMKV